MYKGEKACMRAVTFLALRAASGIETVTQAHLQAQSAGLRVCRFSPTVAIKQDQQSMK